MGDKIRTTPVIDIKTLGISVIVGVIVYLTTCLFWALMIHKEIIQYELVYILTKLSLLSSSLCGCFYVTKKGRGEAFINNLSFAVILFSLGILMAIAYPDKTWDTAGAVICLLICCISCFLMTLQKSKYSKLHKRKPKRRK